MSEEELAARLSKVERVLGLQRLTQGEVGDEVLAGNSTASDHCGNSTLSNHCIDAPEVLPQVLPE
jgi:hypothetical protein